MKKSVIGLILIFFICFHIVLALLPPPAPTHLLPEPSSNVVSSTEPSSPSQSLPICEIDAIILKVNSISDIDIKIISVGEMVYEGLVPDENFSCNEYNGRIIKGLSFLTEGDYKEGQTIKGEIHYFADEFRQGEQLNKVIIISEPEKNKNDYIYYFILLILFILVIFIILKLRKNPKKI